MSPFKKAVKEQLTARIAIEGPTGGGKTYSALVFATALVEGTDKRIAVIDTENGRALAYADEFDFDHVDLRAPYSPQRYVDLINEAIAGDFGVLVIDSTSHAWAAEGGVLDIKDKATERSRSKNSFDAWRHASPEHDKLVNALVFSPIHIVSTMRSKMAYILEEQERDGRKVQVPRKVGMAPVQREGFEYEFDLVLEADLDHVLIATKSRCKDLADKIIRNPNHDPTETYAAARQFRDWLNSGEAPPQLEWLDEMCDTFGEGETLDAINIFRAKAGKNELVSIKQVADVPEDRVALLRSYLEDRAKAVEAETAGESAQRDHQGEEATADDAPAPSAAGDGEASVSPDPAEGSVTGGGDETATSEEAQAHGSTAPSSRNGNTNDPKEVLDRAKKKQKKAPQQAELAEGASSQGRGDDPSAKEAEETVSA